MMRNKGGKKMQVLSNKYSPKVECRESSASDRFNARVQIARQVTRNITALNGELCLNIMEKTMKGLYGKGKR